jgi:hypothetical protein
VTGVPGTVGRSDWQWPRAPGRPRQHRTTRSEPFTVPPLALQAVAFAALAIFAACHWTALVVPEQTRRGFVAALVATGGGVLIAQTGRLPRALGFLLRLVIVAAMLVLAVTAIGIRFKLLMPAGWGTLGDRVTGGLSVVGNVNQWPYGGPNVWLRRTTLIAAPIVLVLASALAFWPGPRDRRAATVRRSTALVLLVLLYGVAVAARPFSAQGLRGLGLLVCLVAWLWLPRLKGGDAAAAATAVGVAALVALILTPQLAATNPWIDYRQWTWSLHKEKTISFDWRQSYGPLHWPRKDTKLLLIKTKEPEYWKAESLDEFDGYRWTTPPLGQRDPITQDRSLTENPKWIHTATITVRDLDSQLVVAPGTILDVHGLPAQPVYLSDGAYLLNGKLSSGDTYTVRSYTPDPSARQMRAAPPAEPFFARYTQIFLPESRGFVTSELSVPLRREPSSGTPDAASVLQGSHYARMYALAKRITAGATTDYDIVRRIGSYLQQHYTYSERVPNHKYPLSAFLFQDERGYCQQFSGAAALMLRMLGVPTRVASGFAPGSKNSDTHEYQVTDLDAHAWIEVWFQGIGWVPFDPTPALAPAASQAQSFALSEIASTAARGNSKDTLPEKRLDQLLGVNGTGKGAGAGGSSSGGFPWGWVTAAALFVAIGIALLVAFVRLRPRTEPPPPSGDAGVDHLVRLLTRLGLHVPPHTTLLDLERRVDRLAGQDAAAYARRLRQGRYGAVDEPPPGRSDRRRLRRILAGASGAGPVTRLRLVMPMRRAPARRARA